MTDDVQYYTIMTGKMSPDVYGGDTCDQLVPRWWAECDGDMDGDYIETLEMSAVHFFPGTRITVQEPQCPKCGLIGSMCRPDPNCDFDWTVWVEEQFS